MKSTLSVSVSLDVSLEELQLLRTMIGHYRSSAGSAGGSAQVEKMAQEIREALESATGAQDTSVSFLPPKLSSATTPPPISPPPLIPEEAQDV